MESASFQTVSAMLKWNAFVDGRAKQFYTTEEAAIVCGFLDLYLNRDSVDQTVREQNQRFQRGAARGDLRREDYQWAEKALDFLQPCWWQSHEDHRALQNALLKTHLLAERAL